MALFSLALLLIIPALLSIEQSIALALPLGVALAAAFFLMALPPILWLARRKTLPDQDIWRSMQTVEGEDLFSARSALMPGLAFLLDSQARMVRIGGREMSDFLRCLREPLGRPFIDQVHVTDRIAFVSAIDALRMGESRTRLVLRLAMPDPANGQMMSVALDMTTCTVGQHGMNGIFVQMLDATREQALAERVDTLSEELQEAHEAKTRFLAAVSHELRTPLNAILGFSDILMGDYLGRLEDERHREYVRLIRQSGGHLLSVVNTMLDMSRIEAGRYELIVEPFAVADVVQDCEKMLGLQAREKGLALTSRIARDVGELSADPRAVRQILINLVGNAIKFTDAGGVVTIDASRSAHHIVISVSDTGIGIAEEKVAELGRPFVQIQSDYSRRYDGVGLGLSLVKGLVALHGGALCMKSRPGEGTVVEITLPADGSGVGKVRDDRNGVEFPPRLQADMQGQHHVSGRQEGLDGSAKAKIA
ncbi:HAMP domain-containing histidine kinase [Allorhizobium sp. BGMRC 0089]|nr:HAMP domain-containing histidine kinase [Allorhizobium sonneratiae]